MKKYVGVIGLLSVLTTLSACGTGLDFWNEEPKVTGPRKAPPLNSSGMPMNPMMGMQGAPMDAGMPPMMPPMMDASGMPQPPAPPIDSITMPQMPPAYTAAPVASSADMAPNMYPPIPLPAERRAPSFNQQALGIVDQPLAAPAADVGQTNLVQITAKPLPGDDAGLPKPNSSAVLPPPPPVGDDFASRFPLPVPASDSPASTSVDQLAPIAPLSTPAPVVDDSGYPKLAAIPPAPPAPLPLANDNRAAELRQDLATAKKQTVSMGGGSKIIVTKPMTPEMAPLDKTPSVPPMPPLAVAERQAFEQQNAMLPPSAAPEFQEYQPQLVGSGSPSTGLMPEGPTIVVRSKNAGVPVPDAPRMPAPPAYVPEPVETVALAPQPPAYAPQPPAYVPTPADQLQPIAPIPSQPPRLSRPVQEPQFNAPPQYVEPIEPASADFGAPSTNLSDLRPIGQGYGAAPSVRYTRPVLSDSRYAGMRAAARRSAQY